MAWLLPGKRQRHGAALGCLLALAFALVLSQTWGLLHGVVHGGFSGSGPQALSDHPATHEPGPRDSLIAVFGHPDSPTDCRLYDQVSHADALPAVVAGVLPLVLQPCVFSVLSGLAVARWHAQFLARGPPMVP